MRDSYRLALLARFFSIYSFLLSCALIGRWAARGRACSIPGVLVSQRYLRSNNAASLIDHRRSDENQDQFCVNCVFTVTFDSYIEVCDFLRVLPLYRFFV